LVGWQPAPDVQSTQLPLLHTLLVPQPVPFVSMVPVSVQVIGEHEVLPAWQALVGVHASPAVQATHAPALHTMFVPHIMPSWTLPASAHAGAPVLHVVVPVRQGLPETWQLAAAVQSTHAPVAPQTLLVPQVVPGESSVPLSVHLGVPVEQSSDP
jgi:hypothetical protein